MDTVRDEIVIIGAGPYGLAATAHLSAVGMDARIFGTPMSFWRESMPKGMLLRSAYYACSISDPTEQFSLNRYQAAQAGTIQAPVPLESFIDYGDWFQRRALPSLDKRKIATLEKINDHFRLELEDGETRHCGRVIIAAGIAPFAHRPPVFTELLNHKLATHSSEHSDLGEFGGKSVIVVGGGQSALESAALLREAGAEVELIVRARKLRFLQSDARGQKSLSPLQRLSRSATDVGPPWLTHLVSRPRALRCVPRGLRDRIAYRSIRPAGAGWLRPRLRDVRITCDHNVLAVMARQGRAVLMLDDATMREADHVLLATGYRVNVALYSFLTPQLRKALRLVNGYPVLNRGFESSIPGLHFLGAAAALSFGPLARFVSGTRYSANALTGWLTSTAATAASRRQILLDESADPTERLATDNLASR